MEKIYDTPEKTVIRMEENESLANAIRRSVEEIPTLAIDEVEFFKNDSALYDEYLAHRIGLVPLKTDKKMSSKTVVEFKLKKVGPCMVYSGDLEGAGEVVHKNIPITLLEKDQELEFVGTAKLGKGLEHVKYSPGLIYYRHLFEVKSKDKEVDKIVESSKGFVKDKKGQNYICDLNEAEENMIKQIDKEALKITNELIVICESYGQMPSKEVLTKAIEIMASNLEETDKAL